MEYRTSNKNKIGFKGRIQNGRVADSNDAVNLFTTYELWVSKEETFVACTYARACVCVFTFVCAYDVSNYVYINVLMYLRARVCMCVCVFTFVCAYDVSNYVYINVLMYLCARVCMCVCVCLHSYVRMMYLIMCILMYLFIYPWCMYIQNITKFLLSHQYTFPVMCLITPRVHVCVLVHTHGSSSSEASWIYLPT